MESVAEGKLSDGSRILTVNTGSSSIKVTLYRVEGASEVPELSAVAERIGVRGGRLRLTNAGGESVADPCRKLSVGRRPSCPTTQQRWV